MNIDKLPGEAHNYDRCGFQPTYARDRNIAEITAKCQCTPFPPVRQCYCLALGARGLHKSLTRRPQRIGLIAYVRTISDESDCQRQLDIIEQYCSDHGYYVLRAFEDRGKPSFGLAEALEALPQADGLIAADLNCFVEHAGDRLRDLRPFIHHFFCHTNKHLIAVKEGMDTRMPVGQRSALELVNQVRELE